MSGVKGRKGWRGIGGGASRDHKQTYDEMQHTRVSLWFHQCSPVWFHHVLSGSILIMAFCSVSMMKQTVSPALSSQAATEGLQDTHAAPPEDLAYA
jgi:hypothetical protein